MACWIYYAALNSILDKAKLVSFLYPRLQGDVFQPFATSANCQTIMRTVAEGLASGICSSGHINTNFPQIIDSILDYSKLEASGGQARSSGRT